MDLVAQITPPSPPSDSRGIANVSRSRSRQYGYPQDLYPEPTHPVNLSPLKVPPVLAHGFFKVSPSLVQPTTRDFPMRTGAQRPVHEFRMVRDPQRHPEINRIVMGRYPGHRLHGFAVSPMDPHVLKPLSSPLCPDPKGWKSHRVLMAPINRAGKYLRFRMNQLFLGCHRRTARRDC